MKKECNMLRLVAFLAFALCLNLVCTANVTTQDAQRAFIRQSSHSHHHGHHQIQHHYNPNISRPNGRHSSQHFSNSTRNERISSETNTKLLPIPSISPTSNRVSNPLKLTLIQTNGHNFAANNYPNAFNTHFYRWSIAPQPPLSPPPSPSTDYDFKWRAANKPFASHFNPTIKSIPFPISTTTPKTTSTTTMPTTTTAALPTMNVHRMVTDHRVHSKHHTGYGRHVCVDYKSIMTPAFQENRSIPCRDGSECEQSRLNYDHLNTVTPWRTGHTIYNCCPGWTKISKHSHGCPRAICKIPCKNNGKCVKPEQCSCSAGYTGRHCELDVNECEAEKPCDQMCYNTEGSFYCTCRLGFILHSDRQSCKKIDSSFGNDDTGTAFEARDLENDVDNDDLSIRMNTIEKLMNTEKERNMETNKLVHHTLTAVNNLKHRFDSLESRQHELTYLRERLKSFEMQTKSLQYTVKVLTNAVNNQ